MAVWNTCVAVILTALLCDSVLCLDKGTEAAAPGKTSLKKTSGNGQKSQAADVQKPIKRKPKGKVQYNISGGSDLSESRPKNAGSSPRGSPDKEKDINDKLPPHKVHGDMYSLPPTSSRSDRDRHKAPIKYDSMRFVDSSNPGSSPARVDNPPVKYDSIRAPIDRNSLGGSRKDYSRSGSGSWRRPFKWILSGSQIKRSGSTASSVDWGSPSQSGGIRVPIPKPYADPDGKMLKHLNSRHWKSLEQLQISFGDVVVCHLVKKKTFEWRKFHWLLATNEDSLVHVYPRDDNNLGVIGERKKSEISSKFMRCDIDSCKNLGNGGYLPSVTYVRYQQWINRIVFYDEKSCSSYHWLVYWVTGHPPRKSVPGASKDLDERCRLVDAEKEDFAPDDTDLLVVTNVEQAKQRAGSNQGDIQDYFTDDSVVASSSPPPRAYSSPPPRAYSSPSPRAYSSPPPRAYSSPPSPPYSRTPPSY